MHACEAHNIANPKDGLRSLGLPQHEMVYCGMSFGYPDADAPVNQLRTERAPLEEIASFRGFAP
jgi:hypothetical protein